MSERIAKATANGSAFKAHMLAAYTGGRMLPVAEVIRSMRFYARFLAAVIRIQEEQQ